MDEKSQVQALGGVTDPAVVSCGGNGRHIDPSLHSLSGRLGATCFRWRRGTGTHAAVPPVVGTRAGQCLDLHPRIRADGGSGSPAVPGGAGHVDRRVPAGGGAVFGTLTGHGKGTLETVLSVMRLL